MIDLQARLKLKESIKRYLDERDTAFKLDDQLHAIQTDDESVNEIISHLWFYYDDCKDHKIVATKEDWDFFQRLLLFLDSDLEIDDLYNNEKRTKRHLTQIAAITALIVQFWIFLQGHHWFAVTALGALVSLPIWIIQRRSSNQLFTNQEHQENERLGLKFYPFSNLSQMLRLTKALGFQKAPYPRYLEGREIRNKGEDRLMVLFAQLWPYTMHFVFSPAILLFESFPIREGLLKTTDTP